METVFDHLKGFEHTQFEAGYDILRQGERKRQIYVLVDGGVEILKNGQQICTVNDSGAVFGELSVLLKTFHNATVRTTKPSAFIVIDKADEFLDQTPGAALHVSKILARRLALLDSYFADLKREFTELSNQKVEKTDTEVKKSSLLTNFLRRAERGLEERSATSGDPE